MPAKTLGDLKSEIRSIRAKHGQLSPDNAFAFWFVQSMLADEESAALAAVVGQPGDIGADVLHIDAEAGKVFLAQTKYHTSEHPPSTSPQVVRSLAELGRGLAGPRQGFEPVLRKAAPGVREKLAHARRLMAEHRYRLALMFVTTGKVAPYVEDQCQDLGQGDFDFQVFQRADLLRLLEDYEEGVAPPVPAVTIPAASSVLEHDDRSRGIRSLLCAVGGRDIGRAVKDYGARLFARNIRGYLGAQGDVNRAIESTLKESPGDFWYFNNGVTIVCDRATRIERSLRLVSPQIINGQQTAYALSRHAHASAVVLLRVIEIPRDGDGLQHHRELTDSIVRATNWQNAILSSDLVANDPEQVRIERELRKRHYVYIRKRQSTAEVRRRTKFQSHAFITKQELAQAVAACVLDPYEVRAGKERLFEEEAYPKIFRARPTNEYLSFYWLGQAARERGRQTRTRPYAKWVVLNRMYQEARLDLNSNAERERFVRTCETAYWYEKGLKPLMAAFDCLYKAADLFYAKNKWVDGDMYDHSLFWKREGLHSEFGRFWQAGKHPYRRTFKRRLGEWVTAMLERENQE